MMSHSTSHFHHPMVNNTTAYIEVREISSTFETKITAPKLQPHLYLFKFGLQQSGLSLEIISSRPLHNSRIPLATINPLSHPLLPLSPGKNQPNTHSSLEMCVWFLLNNGIFSKLSRLGLIQGLPAWC
jgi:hypothetical protein